MTKTLAFSVNQYLCPATTAPTDFLDKIVALGFQGAGITQWALELLPAWEMADALASRGLATTSLNSAGFFLLDGMASEEQDRRNMTLLEATSILGFPNLNVIVGGTSSMSLSVARTLATDSLVAFARQARDRGVQLLIEPLHHLNVRTTSCFNSISQLVPVFEKIPDLRLNVDLFHLWWDPDLDIVLRGDSLPVGLLQICDVVMSEQAPAPRRVPLGEGILPWRTYVQAVQKSFPQVSIELELFANQLPGRDIEDILVNSAQVLSSLSE